MWNKFVAWIAKCWKDAHGTTVLVVLCALGFTASGIFTTCVNRDLRELQRLVTESIQLQSDAQADRKRANEWYAKADPVLAGIESDSEFNRLASERFGVQLGDGLRAIRQDVGETIGRLDSFEKLLRDREAMDERSRQEASGITSLIEQYAKDHNIPLVKP